MQAEASKQIEARRSEVEQTLARAEELVYQKVFEVAQNLQQGLRQRRGKLTGRGAVQLRNLAKQIKSLNVFNDERLKAEIFKLEDASAKHFASGSQEEGVAYDELFKALNSAGNYADEALKALPQTRGVRRLQAAGDEEVESGRVTRRVKVQDTTNAYTSTTSRRRRVGAVA
jgi:hypothetical protein